MLSTIDNEVKIVFNQSALNEDNESINSDDIRVFKDTQKKYLIMIERIPGKISELKDPFSVQVVEESSEYFVSCETFDIFVNGSSEEKALNSFYDIFYIDYLHWKKAKDSNLTRHARKLKQKYIHHVGK